MKMKELKVGAIYKPVPELNKLGHLNTVINWFRKIFG